MKLTGLLNPKNAIKSSSGFKEGYVMVDESIFKVHKPRVGDNATEDRAPILALVWQVTRMEEDGKAIYKDEEDQPTHEELVFSLGGKALFSAHPGIADSPDDEHIEDAGVEINAGGPTLYPLSGEWHPHEKSALMQLYTSLVAKGVKEEVVNRVWAPDFVGLVVHLKSEASPEPIMRPDKTGKIVPQTFSYKVATAVERNAGQGKLKTTKVPKPTMISPANGSEANSEAETALKPLLEKLSEEQTGQSMTKKSMAAYISRAIADAGVNTKLTVPILSLVKDDKWLTANGPKYDFEFNPTTNSLVFNAPA